MGRADLLAAIGLAQTEEDRARIAAFLGFDTEDVPSTEPSDAVQSADSPDVAGGLIEVQPPRARPSIRAWRVDSATFTPLADEDARERPDIDTQGLTLTREQVGRPREPVAAPPRVPAWPRGPALRRAIEQVAHRLKPRGEVDVPLIVDAIVRGEVLPRIPHEAIASRVPRLVVAVDGSQRLFPVWDDQLELAAWIVAELGRDVELCECSQIDALKLAPGDALLVIGDLGIHDRADAGEAVLEQAWAERGRRLRARGVSTHALVVSPADRWRVALVQSWCCIDGADPLRAFGRTRSPAEVEARRERLLELLAWTVRLEPELLRVVRVAMGLDVGTELDVWNHPDARPHAAGLMLDDARRRAILAAGCSAARHGELVQVRELVRSWHAGLPGEIWTEELQALDSLAPMRGLITAEDQQRVLDFQRRLLGYFERGSDALPTTARVRAWAQRATALRVAPQGWEHPVWGDALRELFSRCREQIEQLSEGLTLEGLTPPGPLPALRKWDVWQVHNRLVIRPELVSAPERGSLVVTMLARARRIGVDGQVVELHEEGGGDIELPDADAIELASDCVRYHVCRETRPDWAHAFGRDAIGLWAKLRVGQVEQRMRWIVPGRFMMGSPDSELGRRKDEGPQHRVTITRGFWLADTPCTQEMWETAKKSNPSLFKGARRPVECVPAREADDFFRELRIGGLPTEAQWEYACRAGTTTATYAGNLSDLERDKTLDAIAWYGQNSSEGTHEVGLKSSNRWGLYDMLGNVLEWCADSYERYAADPVQDPFPVRSLSRARRGGGWLIPAGHVRAAFRNLFVPGLSHGNLGFRILISAEQEEAGKGGEPRLAPP